jgi:hypothetical protein
MAVVTSRAVSSCLQAVPLKILGLHATSLTDSLMLDSMTNSTRCAAPQDAV